MIDSTYLKIIEDLNFLNIWVPKNISLSIRNEHYIALLKGYQPSWEMRFGIIYQFEDGYFYAYRSGYVVGKYKFEKRGEMYVCTELYDNPAKSDCMVIFEILKEACYQNKVDIEWSEIAEMVNETTRLNNENEGRWRNMDEPLEVYKVVPSDDEFTSRARLLQSNWRKKQHLKMGCGPSKSSVSIYGNMIAEGESSGMNFYFRETFEYAKWRVMTKLSVETIDSYRLYNNLLSSMPMAFNLFHPLMMLKSENPLVLDALVKRAFPTLKHLHRVTEIGLEFIPTPIANYTGDKSAMDAFIRFQDKIGNNYLIAIEVKYTDKLGTNTASKDGFSRQLAVIEELEMFTDECVSKMRCKEIPITQIYRNFILAEKYGRVHGLNEVYSVILAPSGHPSTGRELKMLRGSLKPEFQDRIFNVHLEDFIEALQGSYLMRYGLWVEWLKERYLE